MGILGADECAAAQSAVGSQCVVHSCTVVRLYTSSSDSAAWAQQCVGAAVIATDPSKKSHFLKVVELSSSSTVSFEQELFKNFTYESPVPFFHTFETDKEVAGFSFADEGDAAEFYEKVQYCMATEPSSISSSSSSSAAPSKPPPPSSRPPPPRPNGAPPSSAPPPIPAKEDSSVSGPPAIPPTASGGGGGVNTTTAPSTTAKSQKKKKGFFGKMFQKEDPVDDLAIGEPTNFRHESSIGWNADSGFEIRNIPPEWKKLFQSAGIKKKDLKNKDTAAMIMETIEQNGGVEAIGEGNGGDGGGGGGGPPPPPPPGAPPPPPAPSAPPPPPGGSSAASGGGDPARGGLLESIRAGKQLAHVDETEIKKSGASASGMAGALASAMAARRGAIAEEDDEEEDEDWSEDWE